MQLCGDKRFFAQRVQHNMCGWLAGYMAGENGLFRRGAEPHRAQRRHAADESVHHDGQPFERTAQKHAAQPGNIKAAQRRQHPQRVRGVGVVAGNAAFYRIYFAVQSCAGKSRTAPGHLGHRAAQQHAGHGAGRRCISDAHFPRRQQLCAVLLLRAHQRDARGDGLHGLCAGHSRASVKSAVPAAMRQSAAPGTGAPAMPISTGTTSQWAAAAIRQTLVRRAVRSSTARVT